MPYIAPHPCFIHTITTLSYLLRYEGEDIHMNIGMNKIGSSGTRLGSDRVDASVLIAARVPAPVVEEVVAGVRVTRYLPRY